MDCISRHMSARLTPGQARESLVFCVGDCSRLMRSLFSPAKLERSMISQRPCSRLILRPSQHVSHHPASRTGERTSGQSSCRSVDKCRRPRGVIVVVQRACEGLLLSRLLRLEVVPLCVILRNAGSCQQLVRRMMSLGISGEITIIRNI